MMAPVIAAQGKKPNARRLLRALLTSDANIIPEPAQVRSTTTRARIGPWWHSQRRHAARLRRRLW